MKMNKEIILLLVWAICMGAVPPAHGQSDQAFHPDSADYLWPTNASQALSGTFAETRSRHFHAALDIKTWGQRGYPVYATRSGTLHRMAVGPTGYGKILYLKHNDGSFSLYAHLMRFNKRLQHVADSIRFNEHLSSFDRVMDSLAIPIEQGEEIALTGATGIGPPHLHFELRTPQEEPFNPLLTNLKIKDNIPPTFSGLAIEPLSIHSKIEDQNRYYTKRAVRGTEYAQFGTITVQEPVGLAVDVFDQANGVSNVYAAYSLRLAVDGQTVLESAVDQFSYEENDQMHIDRTFPLLKSTGRAYQRLFKADGNTLSFFKTQGNGGRLDLSPGVHQITITATDYYGNSRNARATLVVQPQHIAPLQTERYENTLEPSPGYAMGTGEWDWFNNWVNIPLRDFRRMTLSPLMGTPGRTTYFSNGNTVSVDLSQSLQFFFKSSEDDFFTARRVYPGRPAFFALPREQARGSFPARAVYDTTSIALNVHRPAPTSVRIELLPTQTPLRRPFDMRVEMNEAQLADTTLAYYRTYPGSAYLRRLETGRSETALTASLPVTGTYMILPDHTAPSVRSMRTARDPDGQWLVYIYASDRRSGIDHNRTRIEVNGIPGITEYEPGNGRLVYYHPDFTPRSSNRVTVTVYDYAGNKTERTRTISR